MIPFLQKNISMQIEAGAETVMIFDSSAHQLDDKDFSSYLEKVIENMIERHPLKKILSSSEVAKMASFLISEDASSISGQIFNMDAGIVTFKS